MSQVRFLPGAPLLLGFSWFSALAAFIALRPLYSSLLVQKGETHGRTLLASETVLVSGIAEELEAEAICRDVAAAAYLDSLRVKPQTLKAVATA